MCWVEDGFLEGVVVIVVGMMKERKRQVAGQETLENQAK